MFTQEDKNAPASASKPPFTPVPCDPEILKNQNLTMRIRLSTGVIKDLVRKKKLPDASDLRGELQEEQRVRVGILINGQGDVACAHVKEGLPLLAERSIEAAKEWKFIPYLLHDKPIAVESTIEFLYKGPKVKSIP